MVKTAFTLNGHPIAWSFHYRVINRLGKDRDQIAWLYWVARNKDNPVRYIASALHAGWGAGCYTQEWEQRKDAIREWYNQLVGTKPPAKRAGAAMADMLEGLARQMREGAS